jgi:hypothetical protein
VSYLNLLAVPGVARQSEQNRIFAKESSPGYVFTVEAKLKEALNFAGQSSHFSLKLFIW